MEKYIYTPLWNENINVTDRFDFLSNKLSELIWLLEKDKDKNKSPFLYNVYLPKFIELLENKYQKLQKITEGSTEFEEIEELKEVIKDLEEYASLGNAPELKDEKQKMDVYMKILNNEKENIEKKEADVLLNKSTLVAIQEQLKNIQKNLDKKLRLLSFDKINRSQENEEISDDKIAEQLNFLYTDYIGRIYNDKKKEDFKELTLKFVQETRKPIKSLLLQKIITILQPHPSNKETENFSYTNAKLILSYLYEDAKNHYIADKDQRKGKKIPIIITNIAEKLKYIVPEIENSDT